MAFAKNAFVCACGVSQDGPFLAKLHLPVCLSDIYLSCWVASESIANGGVPLGSFLNSQISKLADQQTLKQVT